MKTVLVIVFASVLCIYETPDTLDAGVGMGRVYYQWDKASGQLCDESIRLTASGAHILRIQATDLLGNISSSSFTVVVK